MFRRSASFRRNIIRQTGSATDPPLQTNCSEFGVQFKDCPFTLMQEYNRVPDEYCLKIVSKGAPKTRAKYLKSIEGKKR